MEASSITIAQYLMHAAGIPAPWRVTQCRIDEVAKIAHMWITRHPLPEAGKKRWFGLGVVRAAAQTHAAGPELQWRHLNCMDYTCRIHTVDILEECHHDLPWLGQPGLPFSNRLARQVFACLLEGLELSVICSLLNIPFADLWKFKYALDNGMVKYGIAPAAATPAANARAAAAPAIVKIASDVPDVTDPVWEGIITGALDLQVKTLSFQLILTKLRQQVSMQNNDEVKLMKLRELHRYVERNQRNLVHELQQLRQLSQAEHA